MDRVAAIVACRDESVCVGRSAAVEGRLDAEEVTRLARLLIELELVPDGTQHRLGRRAPRRWYRAVGASALVGRDDNLPELRARSGAET